MAKSCVDVHNDTVNMDFPIIMKAARERSTSQLVRPFNNIVSALVERFRPSNSALPMQHGVYLDTLVTRNPPENKSMFLHPYGGRRVKYLENMDTTLE